jgi:signal transduction histidine kinase
MMHPFAVPRPGDPCGVGLATLRRSVMAARGILWVTGAREGGTAVHIVLPFSV